MNHLTEGEMEMISNLKRQVVGIFISMIKTNQFKYSEDTLNRIIQKTIGQQITFIKFSFN